MGTLRLGSFYGYGSDLHADYFYDARSNIVARLVPSKKIKTHDIRYFKMA